MKSSRALRQYASHPNNGDFRVMKFRLDFVPVAFEQAVEEVHNSGGVDREQVKKEESKHDRPLSPFGSGFLFLELGNKSSGVIQKGVTMTPQERAEKIFANCFTKEELNYLNQQPEFVDLSRNILTLGDTFKAVETGERLIRHTWDTQKKTTFTPKDL